MEATDIQPEDLYSRSRGARTRTDLMSLLSLPCLTQGQPHLGRTASALVQPKKSQLEDGSIKPKIPEHLPVIRRNDVLLPSPLRLFRHIVEGVINQAADDARSGDQDDPVTALQGFTDRLRLDPGGENAQTGDGPGGTQGTRFDETNNIPNGPAS